MWSRVCRPKQISRILLGTGFFATAQLAWVGRCSKPAAGTDALPRHHPACLGGAVIKFDTELNPRLDEDKFHEPCINKGCF